MINCFELNRNTNYEKIEKFCKENDLCVNNLIFYSINKMIRHNVAKAKFRTVCKEVYEITIQKEEE